jgi:hypothetical protein
MQKGEGSRRLGNRHRAKEAADWAEMGPGRSAQASRPSPFQGSVSTPFDLGASLAIYSPLTESHASIHSSSAAKEQRREGHRSGEERVEMVDLGSPSPRGNLAWKTTLEFPELGSRSW